MAQPLCAVLLAGGRLIGPDHRPAELKAGLVVGGRTLLARSVAAATGCDGVGAVAVVAPEALRGDAATAGATWLPARSTAHENLETGALWARRQGAHRALVLTTDLPWLTQEALAAYLAAMPADAQVYGGALTQSAYEARFPGPGNTYARLADGAWTPAGAYVAEVDALLATLPTIRRVYEGRKNPLRIVAVLGPGLLLRMLGRTLTTGHILRRVERLTGLRCALNTDAPPELAADVDTADDLAAARRALDGHRP